MWHAQAKSETSTKEGEVEANKRRKTSEPSASDNASPPIDKQEKQGGGGFAAALLKAAVMGREDEVVKLLDLGCGKEEGETALGGAGSV